MSEPEFYVDGNSNERGQLQQQQQQQMQASLRPSKARSEQRIVIANGYNNVGASTTVGNDQVVVAGSPTSDDVDIFDSHCFATTPSSSNGSDAEGHAASPTSQLLMEYEEHLRNTLEKDSESYSLHTFEALLSRSMENLGKI